MPPPHVPVLLERVTDLLAAREPGVLVDATLGAGGHADALLRASHPGTVLVGFDRDPEALALAADRLAVHGDRFVGVHAGHDLLAEHVATSVRAHGPVRAVLYDLGLSSMQVDRAERGFSFRVDAPLDMRADPTAGATAADLVNGLDPVALAALLRDLGEERFARRIARRLVAARPVTTTGALAEAVEAAVPAAARRAGPHPATRTFQALRIAVNAELDRFGASLPQALELAAPAAGDDLARGGRVAVLAYHSLEDRIAKSVFADAVDPCVCPPDLPVCGCGRLPTARRLTRGAEVPGPDEVAANPRSRSARLRAVETLAVRGSR